MQSTMVSRRDFLKVLGVAAGSLVLASCGGGSEGNQVRIMVDAWALAYAPFKDMAKKYNELHPEVQIKVEASPGGWMTKVVGQMRKKELQWSAAGVMSTFADLVPWVQLNMVQPVDAFIAASKEPGVTNYLSDMLPTAMEDNSFEGKIYGIPFSLEDITYQWNTDWFSKANITQAPTTWQNLYDYAKAVKDMLTTEGNTETYAFGFDLGHLCRNLGTLFLSISDQPYTAEGWFDWDTDEMREALKFMRKLSLDGLTPPNCGEGVEIYDLWTRGRLASFYSCSSRTVWAQKTLGMEKIDTCSVPTFDGNPHSGTFFWCNSLGMLNTAPMPQEAMDFLIYATGPQNTEWQKAIIEAGTSPLFNSVYTNLIEGDPAYAPYQWMTDVRDDIAISVPAPKNYYYPIQNESWNQHRAEYLKDDSTMTEDELIAKVMQTNQDLQKQVLESVPTLTP
jgi:ABC-type glycerol-3-phosphate transport system substrate-binding protein